MNTALHATAVEAAKLKKQYGRRGGDFLSLQTFNRLLWSFRELFSMQYIFKSNKDCLWISINRWRNDDIPHWSCRLFDYLIDLECSIVELWISIQMLDQIFRKLAWASRQNTTDDNFNTWYLLTNFLNKVLKVPNCPTYHFLIDIWPINPAKLPFTFYIYHIMQNYTTVFA